LCAFMPTDYTDSRKKCRKALDEFHKHLGLRELSVATYSLAGAETSMSNEALHTGQVTTRRKLPELELHQQFARMHA
jgi:hypothetical protein